MVDYVVVVVVLARLHAFRQEDEEAIREFEEALRITSHYLAVGQQMAIVQERMRHKHLLGN